MCFQVLAPGLRIGWVTAAPKLVERIIYHMQGIHLGANSFTQASACQSAWGLHAIHWKLL